ncbi:hypothetical protein ILYODFUR_026942 [Ilyodon furcidens]|uniref:Uncharacterized protein n=1 Tax=Ilyodon furcidens TaxID=33524 RepID=A0ABV0UVH7_9TELE
MFPDPVSYLRFPPSLKSGKDSEDPDLEFLCTMFRAQVHICLKVLNLTQAKTLLQPPGTCKPKEVTNPLSGSPACETPACPPSNFIYTSWKETHRNNHHFTTTSPLKLSLRGLTHLLL